MKPAFLLLLLTLNLAGCASVLEAPSPPPTTEQIVQMAKSGQSADQIIETLKKTGAVYPLNASELTALSRQGVPDKVLDYLQKTHIDAEKRRAYWQAREQSLWPYYGPYRYPPGFYPGYW
jgi:hypothetical protein